MLAQRVATPPLGKCKIAHLNLFVFVYLLVLKITTHPPHKNTVCLLLRFLRGCEKPNETHTYPHTYSSDTAKCFCCCFWLVNFTHVCVCQSIIFPTRTFCFFFSSFIDNFQCFDCCHTLSRHWTSLFSLFCQNKKKTFEVNAATLTILLFSSPFNLLPNNYLLFFLGHVCTRNCSLYFRFKLLLYTTTALILMQADTQILFLWKSVEIYL